MRILSQDGRIDLPYENFSLSITQDSCIVAARDAVARPTEMLIGVVAKYSNEAKARKAMEMLHEQYAKLCSLTTLLQGGTELFAKSISQKEAEDFGMEYKNMNVFQFPSNDEVEV